jgi:hypothetical protein
MSIRRFRHINQIDLEHPACEQAGLANAGDAHHRRGTCSNEHAPPFLRTPSRLTFALVRTVGLYRIGEYPGPALYTLPFVAGVDHEPW